MNPQAMVDTHTAARTMTDEQWLEVVVRSLSQPTVEGLAMPAFPSESDVEGSMFPRVPTEATLRQAGVFFGHLRDQFESAGGTLAPSTRVLDVGCGWGRIYRLFLKDVLPTNVFGVDVDEQLIDICKRSFIESQFNRVEFLERLPFEDHTFDLVFANSVLSHLVAPWHVTAVAEWSRVLAPGGVLIATVLEPHRLDYAEESKEKGIAKGGWRWIRDFDEQRRSLAEDGFAWVATGKKNDESGYGMAFVEPGWLRENWPDDLEVLGVTAFADYAQSFAVGKKRPS